MWAKLPTNHHRSLFSSLSLCIPSGWRWSWGSISWGSLRCAPLRSGRAWCSSARSLPRSGPARTCREQVRAVGDITQHPWWSETCVIMECVDLTYQQHIHVHVVLSCVPLGAFEGIYCIHVIPMANRTVYDSIANGTLVNWFSCGPCEVHHHTIQMHTIILYWKLLHM